MLHQFWDTGRTATSLLGREFFYMVLIGTSETKKDEETKRALLDSKDTKRFILAPQRGQSPVRWPGQSSW